MLVETATTRHRVCSLLAVSLLLSGACGGNSPSDTRKDGPRSNGPQWLQSGFAASRSGHSPYQGPTSNKLRWIYALDGGRGGSVAVGSDGTAYLVHTRQGHKATLIALERDGTAAWKQEAEAFSDPVLGSDGTIYVARTRGAVHELVAYGSDGSAKWHHDIGQAVATELTVADGGEIYVGTQGAGNWPALEARLHAVAPSGDPIWSVTLTKAGYVSTPAIAGDTIYVGGEKLRALSRSDGSLKWDYAIKTLAGTYGPAVGPDGTVYAATTDWNLETTDAFYAINPDGTKRWSLATGLLEMTPAIDPQGTVYFHSWPSSDRSVLSSGLFAVRPDGSVKWSLTDFMRADAGDPDVTSPYIGSDGSPIIGAEGTVYMGADTGHLYAINSDGTLRSEINLGFELDNRPSMGADGTLFICNQGGPGHTKCFALSDHGSLDVPQNPWEGHGGNEDTGNSGTPGCEVNGEYGVVCDSAAKCSSGEMVKGCCIAGTCR